jgi:hypothetical protein
MIFSSLPFYSTLPLALDPTSLFFPLVPNLLCLRYRVLSFPFTIIIWGFIYLMASYILNI